RVVVEAANLAGQVDAQDGPGVALEDRALELEQQRRRVRGRADADLLTGPDVEAVAGEKVGEGARIDGRRRHGASMSGKCSARCARSVSRTKRRSSGVAARERMSSSFWPSLGTPAISQRAARRSKRNSTARCHASS